MAKNLMIQGTMSGVGKSILTAGILRVLKQDGYKVAPFKSQNMALNSYVTKDGREIGRAQALQAKACGLDPSSDMNPILIKPMGDTTSQIIVNGLPLGNMKARDYFKNKKSLIPDIQAAYDRLSRDADIIVIEGAGSPVEINLRDNDIVNMGLAQILDAPVLLAGDIDPGGVFAQLLGTVSLMSDEERARVKGLIINKFRGDVTLLEPGLSMFKAYCDIPFAGVVPYTKLSLDEEDSVSQRLIVNNKFKNNSSVINADRVCINNALTDNMNHTNNRNLIIAVIRLPFISNYTDFTIFENIDGVDLYYIDDPDSLDNADLVIIPGTKNTIEDLGWLCSKGLSAKIRELSDKEVPIIGICGGFQMLGKSIADTTGVESGGVVKGLGLLPIETKFTDYKNLKQVSAKTPKLNGFYEPVSDTPISGYEIHMGSSTSADSTVTEDCVIARRTVLGTYIHGIFDTPSFTQKLIKLLYEKNGIDRGIPVIEEISVTQDRELDRLADVLRQSLDFEMIYRIIGL
ncbi:adenosylcobyric acid synthase (glutamine-hydrolysing) [Butyrivibrio fibrisolvens]|uniref:Cobyric acid synthase n=1 Tax=Butyrivibrio fibrisolvens TaxID=831 RepID=A0A1H9W026_BUTFI|nr:cobyric acid synthase [Butyrivibrio fibrisolvens]SES27139.1 adenosylcobyric acid synthase (glutamine-hydrolysing) [Butyrivibrio fibrisolvens]